MSELNVFSNPYSQVQVITCAGCSVTWGIDDYGEGDASVVNDIDSVPLILTGISIQYTRQATPVYPINTDPNTYQGTKYLIYSAPSGSLTCQSIFAPTSDDLEDFLAAVCTSDDGGEADCHGVTMFIKPFAGIKCTNYLGPDGSSASSSGSGDINNAGMILYGVTCDALSMSLQGGAAAQVSFDLTLQFSSMHLTLS